MNISKEELYKLPKDILVELLCKTYDLNNLSQECLLNNIEKLNIVKLVNICGRCFKVFDSLDGITELESIYDDTIYGFIKDPNNETLKQETVRLLTTLKYKPDVCIEKILNNEEWRLSENLDNDLLPKKWLIATRFNGQKLEIYPDLIYGRFLSRCENGFIYHKEPEDFVEISN